MPDFYFHYDKHLVPIDVDTSEANKFSQDIYSSENFVNKLLKQDSQIKNV